MKSGVLKLLAFLLLNASSALQVSAATPFDEYPQVNRQIFVFDTALFSTYSGTEISRQNVSDSDTRIRLGVVKVSSKVTVFVDRINPLVHGSSFLELTDVQSKALLLKLNLGLISPRNHESKLLFNGSGSVYLYARSPAVCFGMGTRKFTLQNGKLGEIKQALIALESSAVIFGSVKLFETINPGSPIVATLLDQSKVTVIGITPEAVKANDMNYDTSELLIKTPLGLSGWYLKGHSTTNEMSGISITTCN